MNEHRIVSESVWYDTVLPSGNLYTKRLLERIVKQFKEDEHLVGKFEHNCSVHYEEQWVHEQSVIESTVDIRKREGATEIMQSEYLFKNGKIRYMVACGGNDTSEGV